MFSCCTPTPAFLHSLAVMCYLLLCIFPYPIICCSYFFCFFPSSFFPVFTSVLKLFLIFILSAGVSGKTVLVHCIWTLSYLTYISLFAVTSIRKKWAKIYTYFCLMLCLDHFLYNTAATNLLLLFSISSCQQFN